MDNQYFKNLERYNRGTKETDQDILARIDGKIRTTKEHINLNNVIDYVKHGDVYLALINTTVSFYGNDINMERIEVITL